MPRNTKYFRNRSRKPDHCKVTGCRDRRGEATIHGETIYSDFCPDREHANNFTYPYGRKELGANHR